MISEGPSASIPGRDRQVHSVIIPIKDYEELLERVQDTDDVAWLKRARGKALHYRPLEEYRTDRTTSAVT